MSEPSPKRSVAATRAVNKAKRKGYGKDTESNTVFFAGVQERESPSTGDIKLTTTIAAEAFEVDLHAGTLADVVSHALLAFGYDSILSGKRMEDGEAQPPLKARAAAAQRITPFRGARTGELAMKLRRTRLTGTTVRAKTTILPPTNRNVYLAQEAKRGNSFIGLGSATDEVIKAAVQVTIDAALQGKLREQNPDELESKKASGE